MKKHKLFIIALLISAILTLLFSILLGSFLSFLWSFVAFIGLGILLLLGVIAHAIEKSKGEESPHGLTRGILTIVSAAMFGLILGNICGDLFDTYWTNSAKKSCERYASALEVYYREKGTYPDKLSEIRVHPDWFLDKFPAPTYQRNASDSYYLISISNRSSMMGNWIYDSSNGKWFTD